jgi:hypothetical protein
MSNGIRSPEEDEARSRCRALAKSLETRIDKIKRSHVHVGSCPTWPLGLVTAFNGWVDLHSRMRECLLDPDLAVDGIYIRDWPAEQLGAMIARSIVDEREEQSP